MHKLKEIEEGSFSIDHPAEFRSNGYIDTGDLEHSLDFAYEMTFGKHGAHRNHRSGGQAVRGNGEIFTDAFQGKLSEFAFFHLFENSGAVIEPPDLRVMGLSEWDSADFVVNGYSVAIKSTKFFGNLLLLETKDWDDQGRYIPNLGNNHSEYDFFVLERIKPDMASLMKDNRLYYSEYADYDLLENIVTSVNWQANLVGFITREELISEVILERQILSKGSILNNSTRMDAENYYVQASDLHPMSDMMQFIRCNHK